MFTDEVKSMAQGHHRNRYISSEEQSDRRESEWQEEVAVREKEKELHPRKNQNK